MANQRQNYSLRDRYNYHAGIANTGKRPDGTKVSTVSRVTHAIRADEIRKERDTFLKGVNFGAKTKSTKNKSKK